MAFRPATGASQVRQHICVEAARILAEEGIADYHAAKRKAIVRLGLPANKSLPTNEEVEQALQEHLRIFHGDTLAERQQHLRRLADEAMRFLQQFDPKLVGPVLTGTITPVSEIQLHLRADNPEEVTLFLHQHNVPFDPADRRIRFGGDRVKLLPAYRFHNDDAVIELVVFSHHGIREVPLSPANGRAMQRANLAELEKLVGKTNVDVWSSTNHHGLDMA